MFAAIIVLPLASPALAQQQLIQNGNFEQGAANWVTSGAFAASTLYTCSHAGSAGYAYLSNNGSPGNGLVGSIYQQFTVPANTTALTVTFFESISTQETVFTTAFDVLNVTINNSSGGFLETVVVHSNINGFSATCAPYLQFGPVQLSGNYAGQSIRLNFLGTTDGSNPTVFRVDDVSVLATVPGVVTGACCVGGATCTANLTTAQCSAQNGVWQNGSATCSNCPPNVIGACCIGGSTCTANLTTAQCSAQSGVWQNGSATCTNCPPPSGMCCAGSGTCTFVPHTSCTGTWSTGGSCATASCPVAAYIYVPIHGQLAFAAIPFYPLSRPGWMNQSEAGLAAAFTSIAPHPGGNGMVDRRPTVFGEWMDGTRDGFGLIVASRYAYLDAQGRLPGLRQLAEAMAGALEDLGRTDTYMASRRAARTIQHNAEVAIDSARATGVPVFVDIVGHSRGGAVAAEVLRKLDEEYSATQPVYFSLTMLDAIDPTGGPIHQLNELAGDLLGDPPIGSSVPPGRSASFFAVNGCCGVFPPNVEDWILHNVPLPVSDAYLISIGFPHGKQRTVWLSQPSGQLVLGQNHVSIADAFAATATNTSNPALAYPLTNPNEFSFAYSTRIGQLLRRPTQPMTSLLLSNRCQGCPFGPRDAPPTEYVSDSTFSRTCAAITTVQAVLASPELAASLTPDLDPIPSILNSIASNHWVADSTWQRTLGTATCSATGAVVPAGETIWQYLDPASLQQSNLHVRVSGSVDPGGSAIVGGTGDGFSFSQPVVPGAGGVFAFDRIIARGIQMGSGAFDRISVTGGSVHITLISVGPPPAGSVVWTLRALGGPSARVGHAMAYDATRGVTVLFGGSTDMDSGLEGSNGETWEWNGTTWTQRLVSGPSARVGHAMAYDATRGVTVLFGGFIGYVNGSATASNETWEWNGVTWTQRLVNGPPQRCSHAMAYDAARHVTVLFGGSFFCGSSSAPAYNSESWEWNGTAWTQRAVSGPSPRGGHAMAYSAAGGLSVLFGGYASVFNGQTWEWSGTTWTQRVVNGPSPRSGHAMAYDAARGVTDLFGGYNDSGSNGDTWEWNGTAWAQRAISGPSPRGGHAMACDIIRGVTVLFGGFTNIAGNTSRNGETWELGVTPCIAPSFTAQPAAQTACPGGAASFTAAAGGSSPLAYQWRKGGVPINTTTTPSAMTATLTLTNVQGFNAGLYDCVVTNPCGSIATSPVALTICAADFNCSGHLEVQDIFDYLNAWFALEPRVDINGINGINAQDIFDFLAAWFTGC